MTVCLNELIQHLRKSYGTYLDFVSYGEKYAIFTNILILTVSRIAFTKIRNLRNVDAIFTNILIVTVSRIAFTKNRNLRQFRRHIYEKWH